MGKGDIKTAKGKRFAGSSGVSRPKKKKTPVAVAAPAKPKVEKKVAESKKVAPKAKKAAAPKKAK